MLIDYNKLGIIIIFASIMGILIPTMSYILGIKNPDQEKLLEYECGFDPLGQARQRIEIKFILIGILFIVFDLEISFLFPFVIIFIYLPFFSSLIMYLFLIILTVGLIYEWNAGGLEWT